MPFRGGTKGGSDNPHPPARSELRVGDAVWIIEKAHYGTKNYKQGIVKQILTPGASHTRGIKVRLMDGSVGRVQWKM